MSTRAKQPLSQDTKHNLTTNEHNVVRSQRSDSAYLRVQRINELTINNAFSSFSFFSSESNLKLLHLFLDLFSELAADPAVTGLVEAVDPGRQRALRPQHARHLAAQILKQMTL